MSGPERKGAIESDPIFQVSIEVVQNKILKGKLSPTLQLTLSKILYSELKKFKTTEYPNTPWRSIDIREAYSKIQEGRDKLYSPFSDAGYKRLSTNHIYRNACITSLKMLELGIHTYEGYKKYLKYPRRRE